MLAEMGRVDLSESFETRLRDWMQRVGCTTWVGLAKITGLSRDRLRRLRRGDVKSLTLHQLQAVCQGLTISLWELLAAAGANPDATEMGGSDRVKETPSRPTWEREAIAQLETLLRQWPTAAYAAEHHNLPARELVKLLHPLEHLVRTWGLEPFGNIGEIVPFNPSHHELLAEPPCEPGTPVSIRYVGYTLHNALWLRAQVRAVSPSDG